ncbi:MAG: amidase [Xanthomonadales bacterium]|nr:amidase [Xanthomonadales bacterium]
MRIKLLLLVLLLGAAPLLSAAENYSPLYKTVAELEADLNAGKTSSAKITAFYLARIKALNPRYHAVISTNPDAGKIAAQFDKERAAGKLRGPLHGIPVLLKDNINSRDPIPTTAGSLALKQNYALKDAFLVKKLRAAGAVILGKANLSEWANMRSTQSISGWSAIGGFTRNAWDVSKNPCGSSSGSAVAAALNLAPLTVGSETDGSILCPASMNGVVGFKPSAGMVSQAGIVPISHSQDTAGPITRSVADAVFLLQGMLADDAGVSAAELGSALENMSLKGITIGVARFYNGHDSAVDKVFESALEVLKQAGATLVDVGDNMRVKDLGELEIARLLADMKADMRAYLKNAPAAVKVRSMEDLVAFNKANKDTEMVHFAQEFFEYALKSPALDSKEYQQMNASIKQHLSERGIAAILKNNTVDLLVAPSYGVAGLLKNEHDSATEQPGSTQLSAVAGLPTISVPMGMIKGLPLGLSFMAGMHSEPLLIRAAAGYEKTRGAFAQPEIKH